MRLARPVVKGKIARSRPSLSLGVDTLVAVLLALDLDGVLCDLAPGVAARVASRFGVSAHPATWRSYDLAHLGLPHDELRPFLDELFADPSLYEAAPACAGAAGALRSLVAGGWTLIGLTARAPHLAAVTERWLHQRGLPVEEVHHAPALSKSGVAARLRVDATIEDNAAEAELLGEVCESWLLDRPYNRHHEPVACRRLHSWDDAVGRLCQLRLFA